MHSNLTRTPTKYPAPVSIYGSDWFYVTEKAEHAHRAYHTVHDGAEAPKPDTVPATYKGVRWRAADGEKPCAVCGRGFAPGPRPTQVTCSSECSRERKKETTRLNSRKLQAERKANQ